MTTWNYVPSIPGPDEFNTPGPGTYTNADPNAAPQTMDQALALWKAGDVQSINPDTRDLFNRLNSYYQQGQFAPGSNSKDINTKTIRDAEAQWARDAQPGGLDKFMSMAIPVAILGATGLGVLGGLGDVAAGAATEGATAADAAAYGDVVAATHGAEGALGSMGASTSITDAATKAVTDYIAKISPESIGTQLGQSAIARGVSAALQGQDPLAAVQQMFSDPGQLVKGLATGQALGAAGAGLTGAGTAATGLGSSYIAPLSSAALQGATTGKINPFGLALGEAGTMLKDPGIGGLSPGIVNAALPVASSLLQGKTLNWPGLAATSGLKWVGNQMKNTGG